MLLAGVSCLGLLAIGFVADRWLVFGMHRGEAVRQELTLELGRYLPTLVRSSVTPAAPPKPLRLPTFQGLLPRTTAAIVITLTASLLAMILVTRWVVRTPSKAQPQPIAYSPEEAAPPDPPRALAPPSPPPTQARPTGSAPSPASSVSQLTTRGACSCPRADSVLWREAIPRLSTLLLSRRARMRGNRKRLELEVAAVNNGNEPLSDISLMIQFLEEERGQKGFRPVAHRAVFFAGPLEPGKAIKWSIEARGTHFEITNPVEGDIGPGGDGAATRDQLADLLNANHRPVRLHGAMMLAYLGDPRAKRAALDLRDALREDEASYLQRLLWALGETRVCQVRSSDTQLTACVFNASDEARDNLGLRVRSLDRAVTHQVPTAVPPTVLEEWSFAVPGSLEPQQGVAVTQSLAGAKGAVQLEAFADRIDLLP